MNNYTAFSELLLDHLSKLDRSQSWLAQQIGVSRSTVSRWINEPTRPQSYELIQQIGNALNITDEQREQLLSAAGYSREKNSAQGTRTSSKDDLFERQMSDTLKSLRIYVESTDGERFEAEVPIDTPLSTLAADFFDHQNWSTRDSRGRQHRAVIELVNIENPNQTKRLRGEQTINEVGIQNDDVLRIFPESIAGCFLGQVIVVLANGDSKPIQDVQVGDSLLSIELTTREFIKTEVSQVFIGTTNEYLTLNESLYVTHSHPIWANGKWARASELKIGDRLLGVSGKEVILESIAQHNSRGRVFNLHVTSKEHSFFADGVLVHNMDYKQQLSAILNRDNEQDFTAQIEELGSKLEEIDVLKERLEILEFKLDRVVKSFGLLGQVAQHLQGVEFTQQERNNTQLGINTTIAQLHLDRSIHEFDRAAEEELIAAIAVKTSTPILDIKLVRVDSGSVLVTLEMPEHAALELMRLYLSGNSFVDELNIEKIELRPLPALMKTETKLLSVPNKTSSPIRILFLAANPKGTEKLRLDEEVREIDDALLQRSEFRNKFEIVQQWAVRISDLQNHLLRFQPNIVHFSGHGSSSNEIILEDTKGNLKAVSKRALSDMFSVLQDNIRCVVLNACFSEPQAEAIAKHIECVIGMSDAIGDNAAISFAKSFYQALGYGRSVDTAFKLVHSGVNKAIVKGVRYTEYNGRM